MKNIMKELDRGHDLIINTTNLTSEHRGMLINELKNKGLIGKSFFILNQEERLLKIDIHEKIKSHEKYVQTLGKQGEELIVDEFQFEGEELVNVNLSESSLTDCSFEGSKLENVDFYKANLYSSSFLNTKIIQSSYVKSNADYTSFNKASINETNFQKAELPETDFSSSAIKDSSFISADLREANFSNSILENVDFKYTWFKDTILKNVIIKNPINLNEAAIKSINIGTVEEPEILEGEHAVKWMLDNVKK